MTRAAGDGRFAARLDAPGGLLDRVFARAEALGHAVSYVRGLASTLDRKSVESIARAFGGGRVSALQKFVNVGPWRAEDLFRELQAEFGRACAGPAEAVVLEHAFPKKGDASVGVARQLDPATGRPRNCQVGVFLVGCHPAAEAVLASRLYLPPSWLGAEEAQRNRRARTRVPAWTHNQTRGQVGEALVRLAITWGQARFSWVVLASGPGVTPEALDLLEDLGQRYLVPIRHDEPLEPAATADVDVDVDRRDASATPLELMAALPARSWRSVALPGGSGPPTIADFATVAARSPRHGGSGRTLRLCIRRRSGLDPSPAEFYLSNAHHDTPPAELARGLTAPDRARLVLAEADRRFGIGHYETRSWVGWHHHMGLVSAAHWLARGLDTAPQ